MYDCKNEGVNRSFENEIVVNGDTSVFVGPIATNAEAETKHLIHISSRKE